MGRPKKKVGDLTETDLETRRRIIRAAEELFVNKGFNGVSMKEVAEAVQVTPAALYYHFPEGKEDLFLDIIKNMFDELAEGLAQSVKPAENIRERLRLLMLYSINHKSGQMHMLWRDVHQCIKDENKRQGVWKQYKDSFSVVVNEVLQQAVNRGELTEHIPIGIMSLMYHGMNIAMMNYLRQPDAKIDSREADRLVQAVVSGLLDGIGQHQTAATVGVAV